MKACVDEYNLIKKNKGRASKSQITREKDFSIKLDLLFDISHKDANKLIKIDEDKIFLEDQKNARMMKMAGEDVKLSQQEKRTAERQQAETKRKQNEEKRRQKANAVLTLAVATLVLIVIVITKQQKSVTFLMTMMIMK